jgi:hypothetical protein
VTFRERSWGDDTELQSDRAIDGSQAIITARAEMFKAEVFKAEMFKAEVFKA